MKQSRESRPSKILPRRELQTGVAPRLAAAPRTTPARKSARGKCCTLMLPGCPNAIETVVLCHLRVFGGGGIGLKPWDGEAIYADDWCHSRLDGRVPWIKDAPAEFNLWEHIAWAIVRTHRIMRDEGVLMLKGEAA